MIRRSIQRGKQVIIKLVLHHETVRRLEDSELSVIVGGQEAGCSIQTHPASSCTLPPNQ
jgi:hypothetical protein